MTSPPTSGSAGGELELRIGADPKQAESLRQNLKVRALFVPTTLSFPSRSRIRVKIVGSDPAKAAYLMAEVVFSSPAGVGLQVLELDPSNQARLDELLGARSKGEPAPKPAAAPPPPPVQAAPPPVQPTPPPVQVPIQVPVQAATTAPAAPRLTVPAGGTLSSDLPALVLATHHQGGDFDAELPPSTALGLIQRLAREQFTGALIVETEDKTVTHVFFRAGIPVGGHHEPEEEITSIGYALRKSGKLPESDYREIRRKHLETKEPEVKLLAQIVDAAALQKGLRVVIFQNVGKVLAAKTSKYRLEAGAHVLAQTMPLPVQLNRVVYRALVEAAASYSNDELLVGLEPYLNLYVSRKEKLPLETQQLRLDDKELRFLNVTLVTPTRLRTIFSVSALNRSGTLRNLYALFLLHCLHFQTNYQPPEKEFLPHLNRVWSEVQSANHFEILQVHWTQLGPTIEAMYQKTRKEWEETLNANKGKPEYVDLIQKILGKIDESFRFLSDNDRRRQYRDEIIEAPKRAFSAELLSQHTRTYILRGDKKQARYYIDMALDIAPGNAEFRMLLKECGG